MKETDDGKTIDGQDAGAVPAASTNSRVMYQGIFDFAKILNAYYSHPMNGADKECGDHYPMKGTVYWGRTRID